MAYGAASGVGYSSITFIIFLILILLLLGTPY